MGEVFVVFMLGIAVGAIFDRIFLYLAGCSIETRNERLRKRLHALVDKSKKKDLP